MKKLILHGFIGLFFLVLTAVFSTPVFALLGIAESENASGLDCDEVFRKEIRSKEGSDAEKNQSYTVDKAILSKKDNDYCLFRLISINPGFEGKFENTLKISYVEDANNMASKVSELKSQEGGSQVQSFSDDGLDYSVSSKDLAKTVLVLKHCIIEQAFIDHSGTYDAEQMADMARSGGLALQMGNLSTVSSFCGGTASADQKTKQAESQSTQSNAQDNEKDKSQKSKEQTKIGLPLFATGWLRLFETFWNAAGVNASSIIKNINMIGGMDHTLCDPATCSKALEAAQRGTNLTEEEVILRSQSARANATNPYQLHEQTGNASISDYDKSKGFIMVTGKDDVIFSTFIGLEGDKGGLKVSPNTKIELPPEPFQKVDKDSKTSSDVSSQADLDFGEVEIIIIGSAEKPTTRPTFAVATPNTEVKVFGTHFWVKHDPDKQQTTVGVYEGEVEVTTKSGQKTLVSPNGDKPGVVIVAQKLSVLKLISVGTVLVVIIGGVILFLKRRGNKVSAQRK